MINQDTIYWLWLAERCGPASKQFDSILSQFQNPFDLYRLQDEEVEQLSGLTDKLKAKLCDKTLDNAYATLKYCKQNHIDIISYGDKSYPERLKLIQDPPILLYCKGHFPNFDAKVCIGVVGTRKMSAYGKEYAYRISYELASAEAAVVSGMALGVDALAASGALAAGGTTVAVLGCGIKRVYPKAHARLMDEIAMHGAVITEYGLDEGPWAHNFPMRNRIISALCQGVFVVEAAAESGALITAKYAIGHGRELFALPGKLGEEGAEGPNRLIKDGAYPVLSSEDILSHYDFLYGDAINRGALERARKNMPEIEAVLEKYGLTYALGNTQKDKPEIFYPKRGGRTKSTEAEKPATAEIKAQKPAEQVEKAAEMTESREQHEADNSGALLASLDATTLKIFESIPHGRAVGMDELVGEKTSIADVLTALTLLEVMGFVSSLPGGLYIRK